MKEKAWSFSSLTNFEGCPRRYYYTKEIKEVVEPPTEATEWGIKVHEALEHRIRDKTELPEFAAKWEKYAKPFDKFGESVWAEQQVALTRNFKPTGFFDDDCWYRGVLDVVAKAKGKAIVADWKTGKVKNDHDQLKLFAATAMTIDKAIEEARTMYVWLAHDKVTRKDFKQDDVPAIWSEFTGRVRRLEAAREKDKWLPNPSGLCNGWCPVGRDRCEFWKPKRR